MSSLKIVKLRYWHPTVLEFYQSFSYNRDTIYNVFSRPRHWITKMFSPHPNVLTTLNTFLAWHICLNIVRPSLVSQLALHLHDFRRKFCTHYLFPMHTTYPAHHMFLCFINVAVFGVETNIQSSLYVSYLLPSATWPITSSAHLLPIEQWDRGFESRAVLKCMSSLALFVLCCVGAGPGPGRYPVQAVLPHACAQDV